jgi:hypothetical protein
MGDIYFFYFFLSLPQINSQILLLFKKKHLFIGVNMVDCP